MSTDYPDAILYLVDESRVFVDKNSHSAIVLHGTGGSATQTAQELGDYFRTNSAMVSVNFGIDRAGVVAQYVLLKDGAGGNCCIETGYDTFWNHYVDTYSNLNNCTISIEHVNDATNSLTLTEAQQQASFKLIAYLCQKYNIAPDHIKSHASIAPQSRARCPGPAYPWQTLYTFLGASNVATLEDFPMISQLDNDINAQFDCVPTSLAAALQYLTGIKFSGSEVKDAVYGVGYQGVTAPDAYIGYCAKHGVLLSPYNGTNVALVAATKEQIAHGHPVLLTEIDPYMPISSGATHVVAAYACNADSITVMDPYIDQGVTKTDQEWQADLQSGQIWIVEKGALVLDISQVSNYFTETTKDTRWHCAKTNQDVAYGILTYYRTCTSVALNGMSQYGLPTSTEQGVPGVPGATFQVFERGIIVYDPNHAEDSVPGVSGPCYPGHLNKFLQAAPVSANVTSALSTLHSVLATTATLQAATGALNTGLQSVINELGNP